MSYASGRPHPNTILTPTSLDSTHNVYASPTPMTVKSEWGDSGQSNDATPDDGSVRKKQKRNKPTLSCHECVERKTKVSHLDPSSCTLHCTLHGTLRACFIVRVRCIRRIFYVWKFWHPNAKYEARHPLRARRDYNKPQTHLCNAQ